MAPVIPEKLLLRVSILQAGIILPAEEMPPAGRVLPIGIILPEADKAPVPQMAVMTEVTAQVPVAVPDLPVPVTTTDPGSTPAIAIS